MRSAGDRERLLAAAAGDGDERAFAELVRLHREALVRFVACRSGRGELAEDAVQEALVSAHRALRAGQRPTDVRAWLHTIAWHRALDLVRRERETVPLDVAATALAAAGPEPAVLRAGELDRIVAHWSALPRRQRQALVLSVFEGRSLEQIAATLGVTESAAKSLVARARRTLAGRMAAPELTCDAARPELLAAAERGVRLRGDVHRHVRGCRACARLHRSARLRRRVRAVVLVPVGLLERGRDLVYVTTAHEPQVSLVTKLCATACAATIAGGAGTASVVVTAPQPLFTELVDRSPDREERQERQERQAQRERQAPRAAASTPAPQQVAASAVTQPPAQRTSTSGTGTTTRGAFRHDPLRGKLRKGALPHPAAVGVARPRTKPQPLRPDGEAPPQADPSAPATTGDTTTQPATTTPAGQDATAPAATG